jgi:uncharacterized linocin/CFP29 family protein
MNHLFRELAPVLDGAWSQIEAEASRSLQSFLAARKIVDFVGPLGWDHSAHNLGRIRSLDSSPAKGVDAAVREVQPLVEFRTPFTVSRAVLDAIERGSQSPDLETVIVAARNAAAAEDGLAFNGFEAVGVGGICDQSPHQRLHIDEDYEQFPSTVARAVEMLREAGVDGPYSVALGPHCYTQVIETTQRGGYPVLEQLRLITRGSIVWAPVVNGSVVISMRGGDYELVTGEDFSIGFRSYDADSVNLYLEESLTFRVLTPEAAVYLTHGT